MNSGHIIQAIARHLNWRQGTLIPEAVVNYRQTWTDGKTYTGHCEYFADLMWITRDRYATEIEVKVSRADWRADLVKGKWRGLPSWVTRFIYAVPAELGIPDFVPPQAGIWHIHIDRRGVPYVKIARAPKRIGKDKVPEKTVAWWEGNLYYRYWHNVLHRSLPKLAAVEAAA